MNKLMMMAALISLSMLGMSQATEDMSYHKARRQAQAMPMANLDMPNDCQEKCASRKGHRYDRCVIKCDRCLDQNKRNPGKCLKHHPDEGKHHKHHCKDANDDPTKCARHPHHKGHRHGHHKGHGHHQGHGHGHHNKRHHHHHTHHDEAKTVAPEGSM